jgi:hypothetical protein
MRVFGKEIVFLSSRMRKYVELTILKKKKRRKIVFDQVANRKPFVVLNKKKTII